MMAVKELEFVLACPKITPGLWKLECFKFKYLEYMKITSLATEESVLGRVIYPKGELPHIGNWRDSRRFSAFM